jgi:hypothetical protein
MQEKVFSVGKSLALLKLVAPGHHLGRPLPIIKNMVCIYIVKFLRKFHENLLSIDDISRVHPIFAPPLPPPGLEKFLPARLRRELKKIYRRKMSTNTVEEKEGKDQRKFKAKNLEMYLCGGESGGKQAKFFVVIRPTKSRYCLCFGSAVGAIIYPKWAWLF